MSTIDLVHAKNLCVTQYESLGINVHIIGSFSREKLELFMSDVIIWVDCLNANIKNDLNGSRQFIELSEWISTWKDNVCMTKDGMHEMMAKLLELINRAKIAIIALFIHMPNDKFEKSIETAEIYYSKYNQPQNKFNKILALSLSDNFKKIIYGKSMFIDREIVINSLINHLENKLFEPNNKIYPCFLEKTIILHLEKKVFKMSIDQIFLNIWSSTEKIEEFISIIIMINGILREIHVKRLNVCEELIDIKDSLIIHHTANIFAEHHFFDQIRNNSLKELQGIFILGQNSNLIPGLFILPPSESYSKNVGYIYANYESKKFIVDISKEGSLYICVDAIAGDNAKVGVEAIVNVDAKAKDNTEDYYFFEAIPNTIFNFNSCRVEYLYTVDPLPRLYRYDDIKSNANEIRPIEIIENNEKDVTKIIKSITLDGKINLKVSAIFQNNRWNVKFILEESFYLYRKLKTYDQIISGQHSDPFELKFPTTLKLSYWIFNYLIKEEEKD